MQRRGNRSTSRHAGLGIYNPLSYTQNAWLDLPIILNRRGFPLNRLRYLYVIAMVAVIASGLWWRSTANPVSPFWQKYGGDALWALLLFLGFRCVLISTSLLRVTLVSLAFCFLVEFSQLYHAPWLDSIRHTRFGALALGSTFNAPDLLAYAVGVAFGGVIETVRMYWLNFSARRKQVPEQAPLCGL